MTGSENIAANDDGFDPLQHIDPLSRSFYSDAAATAAYLVNGKGRWLASSQCVVTAAIMHHVMLAARENRVCSLSEVQSALAEASRRIESVRKATTLYSDLRVGALSNGETP